MKPRIFYLTEFPNTYRSHYWWSESEKIRAEQFVKDIKRVYGVQGKVIKVQECPKTTRKKNQ